MMIFSLALAIAAAPPAGCTKGSEFEPSLCPTHLPAIAAVTVERVGVTSYVVSPGEPPCAQFRPTKAQIIRYLSKARTASGQAFDATLDRSPCQAEGIVRYVDGSTAKWRIEQLGVGLLWGPGRDNMYLYCLECTEPPFVR